MALLDETEARAILERPAVDPRVDEHGLVSMAMPVAEFEAFLSLLNSANIAMEHTDGAIYRLNFTPHFIGNGLATLEMNGVPLEAVDG